MKIYKFGGASIKDAQGIRNVCDIVKSTPCDGGMFIVVSAIGKTTNALEEIIENKSHPDIAQKLINQLYIAHRSIILALFDSNNPIFSEVEEDFDALRKMMSSIKPTNFNYLYDQIVSQGEFLSSRIVQAYMMHSNITCMYLDARDYIKTDANYREAKVDWFETSRRVAALEKDRCYVTQGFIGSDENYATTTLGREGSDYTAAIFGHCLDAQEVSIWKDVPGILNADPRNFEQTVLLEQMSYEEAIELAYYGASVIHPKTLQPLKDKSIPLWVRSFLKPNDKGTIIKKGRILQPNVPCSIMKQDQYLMSIKTRDFAFIVEENLSEIFKHIAYYQIKINLIQNTAISLKLCLDDPFHQKERLFDVLQKKYDVHCVDKVSLYTIRHYDKESLANVVKKGEVLLFQKVDQTAQLILKV